MDFSAIEFKIGNLTCRAGKMNARKQFHVARRLAPLLGHFMALRGVDLEKTTMSDIDGQFAPFLQTLSDMPDEQVDYIMDACQAATEVKLENGVGWAPLRNNNVVMFPMMSFVDEGLVVFHVIRANMAGFMSALPVNGGAANPFVKSNG